MPVLARCSCNTSQLGRLNQMGPLQTLAGAGSGRERPGRFFQFSRAYEISGGRGCPKDAMIEAELAEARGYHRGPGVYFILERPGRFGNGAPKWVKIGLSDDVDGRLPKLRTGGPNVL